MQPVTIDFSERIPVFTKDYTQLFFILNGQVVAAHSSWDMDEKIVKIVKQIIQMSAMNYLRSKPDISIEEYSNEIPGISASCIQGLNDQHFEVQSLNISSIVPDEASMEMIRKVEQMNIIKGMSSDDITKMVADEHQKAMEMMGMQGGMAPMQGMQGGMVPTQGMQGGVVPAMDPKDIKVSYPNFCPNCGTKTAGTNFCANCGYKLR